MFLVSKWIILLRWEKFYQKLQNILSGKNWKFYEEEQKTPYITSVEQIGYDRGQVVGYDRGIEEADQRSQEQLLQREQSIALNMLRKNLDLDTIAKITGLTIAQIQDLQSQLESE